MLKFRALIQLLYTPKHTLRPIISQDSCMGTTPWPPHLPHPHRWGKTNLYTCHTVPRPMEVLVLQTQYSYRLHLPPRLFHPWLTGAWSCCEVSGATWVRLQFPMNSASIGISVFGTTDPLPHLSFFSGGACFGSRIPSLAVRVIFSLSWCSISTSRQVRTW